MKTFYYIYGNMGLTSSGSFTRNKSRWIVFTEEESKRIVRPYAATKTGIFIETGKFEEYQAKQYNNLVNGWNS